MMMGTDAIPPVDQSGHAHHYGQDDEAGKSGGNERFEDPAVDDYIEPYHEEHIQAQTDVEGGRLSPSQLEEQATALTGDAGYYDRSIDFLKKDVPGYENADNEVQATDKANVALMTQMRLKASNFDDVSQKMSPEETAQYNANITNAALGEGSKDERGQNIRDIISEANGGDDSSLGDMSNEQVADLYGVNVHNYNHTLLAKEAGPSGNQYFHMSHAFVVNDNSTDGYTENDPRHGGSGQHVAGDGSPQGTLAFYNDTGAHVEEDSNGTQHSLEAIIAETREVYQRTEEATA
jgi:hypothetical protein